ncbi:MAG: cation:proton antiporter [Spirochaetes bacterium]|nr:MAG: cation:proton antiporter [Spirochaetota bacterium]RLJ04169.1 MAG: cation:proton antiporter [Candidatus Aenigmarchaeota archaeon]
MKGMTIIIKKVAQILCGIIFLYGIYIILHGHLTPGGGFAGGAIIAGAFILLVIAFGSESPYLKRSESNTSIVESGAILAFLIIAVLGLSIAGYGIFFKNFLPKGKVGNLLSAGLLPVYNIVVGIEVAAALFTIFLALIIYREEVSK